MYGTGNQIIRPPNFIQSNDLVNPQLPGPPIIKVADFPRTSRRPAQEYLTQAADPSHSTQNSSDSATQRPPQAQVNGHDEYSGLSQTSHRTPPQSTPPNQAPPPVPHNAQPGSSRDSISVSRSNRQSMPLPNVPIGGSSRAIERSQTPPPSLLQQPSGNTILFYGQYCNFYEPCCLKF